MLQLMKALGHRRVEEWRLDSQGPISSWSPRKPKKKGMLPLVRSKV